MSSNRDIDVSFPRLSPLLTRPLLRSHYGAFRLPYTFSAAELPKSPEGRTSRMRMSIPKAMASR